jgi:hypothetical protein
MLFYELSHLGMKGGAKIDKWRDQLSLSGIHWFGGQGTPEQDAQDVQVRPKEEAAERRRPGGIFCNGDGARSRASQPGSCLGKAK